MKALKSRLADEMLRDPGTKQKLHRFLTGCYPAGMVILRKDGLRIKVNYAPKAAKARD